MTLFDTHGLSCDAMSIVITSANSINAQANPQPVNISHNFLLPFSFFFSFFFFVFFVYF